MRARAVNDTTLAECNEIGKSPDSFIVLKKLHGTDMPGPLKIIAKAFRSMFSNFLGSGCNCEGKINLEIAKLRYSKHLAKKRYLGMLDIPTNIKIQVNNGVPDAINGTWPHEETQILTK